MLKKVRKFLHHHRVALGILGQKRQEEAAGQSCCKAVDSNDLKRCDYTV